MVQRYSETWHCSDGLTDAGLAPPTPPPQSESSKEQFRKYLESAGAIDAMVKGESDRRAPSSLTEIQFRGRGHGALEIAIKYLPV